MATHRTLDTTLERPTVETDVPSAATHDPATDAGHTHATWAPYVVESIGTFFLVLTIGCTVLSKSPLAPLAIGAILMTMIFAGGHVSGGHFNPAVTLAVTLRGRLPRKQVAPYMACQLLGGLAGGWVAGFLTGHHGKGAALDSATILPAFIAELAFTFALCWVVLNVATSKSHTVNSFYGLAIGFTVLAGAVSVGAISGGAFNPAVAVSADLMGLGAWSDAWLYVIANFTGAALAAALFRGVHPTDR